MASIGLEERAGLDAIKNTARRSQNLRPHGSHKTTLLARETSPELLCTARNYKKYEIPCLLKHTKEVMICASRANLWTEVTVNRIAQLAHMMRPDTHTEPRLCSRPCGLQATIVIVTCQKAGAPPCFNLCVSVGPQDSPRRNDACTIIQLYSQISMSYSARRFPSHRTLPPLAIRGELQSSAAGLVQAPCKWRCGGRSLPWIDSTLR